MTTIAWFHCFSGIAGDMALGSLIDAGADVDEVRAIVGRLPVPGWELSAEPVLRGGIAGTKARVLIHDSTVVRTAAHITALIEEARLPERVRQRSLDVFVALAEAEGRLHRKPPSQVHFHEVGGLDAIVDVVGTCAALEVLGVDEVRSSPVTTGLGMVRAAHGTIPNPSPAVVELLRGAPTRGLDVAVELTTPTGAALLAGIVSGWGAMPEMTVVATGFGAGTRELDGRPNLTQVVIGDAPGTPTFDGGQPVLLIETNVDDATGEVLAHAVEELLEAGALDAWIAPVLMKKGRPGHVVSAIADPSLSEQVAGVMLSETGTLGVRVRPIERWTSTRDADSVEVDGLSLRVKVSPGRVKVEYDDAARASRRLGRPLREVQREAEEAWHRVNGGRGGAGVVSLHGVGGAAEDDWPHDHDHGHSHDHGHGHDHGHSHDHGHWHSHPHSEGSPYEEGPADPAS